METFSYINALQSPSETHLVSYFFFFFSLAPLTDRKDSLRFNFSAVRWMTGPECSTVRWISLFGSCWKNRARRAGRQDVGVCVCVCVLWCSKMAQTPPDSWRVTLRSNRHTPVIRRFLYTIHCIQIVYRCSLSILPSLYRLLFLSFDEFRLLSASLKEPTAIAPFSYRCFILSGGSIF